MSSTPLRCVSSYHLLEREDVAGEDVAELRHGEVEMVWCDAGSVVCRRARVEFSRRVAVSCAAEDAKKRAALFTPRTERRRV